MDSKKIRKLIISAFFGLLLVVIFSAGMSASAANTSSQAEIDSLNKQIAELKDKINKDKNDLSKQKSVKNDLDKKISAIQRKITLVTNQINAAKADIAKNEAEIKAKNEEIEDCKEAFKKRLYQLYTSNTGSNLQVLLGAESFDDLLIRAELIKCMSAQDNKIINELTNTIDAINAKIAENDELKAQLEKDKASLALDKAELDGDISDVNNVIKKINNNISSEEKDLKSLNNYMQELLYGGEVDIDFSGKFIWPVPGQYRVSCEFDSHDPLHPTGHNGMDIVAPMNAKIVAAAKGQVTKLCNTCKHNYGKRSSCGCGNGFGNHVRLSHGLYNGHYYITIYGHMTSVASGITVGKMVNQGQVIGYVGTTGFSTGYHLHFAVAWSSKSNAAQGYAGQYLDPRKYIK